MSDTQDLRTIARTLYDAAVTAADPALALRRELQGAPLPPPAHGGRTVLVAIGKAAPRMMAEALAHVHGPHEALVVTHHQNTDTVPGARLMKAGHPVPDDAGATAARALVDLLQRCTVQDRVIALISGGGSALIPAPVDGLTLSDKAHVNSALLASGLEIQHMNLVRQQLSRLKGGGLLQVAAPATVTAYILSDVIGDDLRAIASGPTVGPIGTASDAIDVLQTAGIWSAMPPNAQRHLENRRANPPVPEANNILIGSNKQSLEAMLSATPKGWISQIACDALIGDVGTAAAQVCRLIATADKPRIFLFGGETTVALTGSGRGGRNQEMALRVAMTAPDVAGRWLFLSGGTDGRDGPTMAAGGYADAHTVARISAAGSNARALLDNNDSHAALACAGDLLITEATGTNVADVQVLLLAPQTH